MKILQRAYIFIILFTFFYFITFSQKGTITLVDNTTADSTTPVVKNYIGCKRWYFGICQQCSDGYYFDNNGVCQQTDPNCRQFNQQAGICQNCYQGYTVADGICVLNQTNNTTDPGCKTWNNNKCITCSQRWYFDINGKCQKVDDNCRTWNNSGICLSCYNGYDLRQGKCIVKNNHQTIQNPLCKTWNGTICNECSYRAFFNQNLICQEVNANCNTWDKLSGICITCYQGYTLQNGDCIVSNNNTDWMDPLCKRFDWQKRICIQCSQRSFQNQQGICTQVSPLCKTYDQLSCTSCYSGFSLNNGQCIIRKQDQNNTQPSDPGCAKWDWSIQKCLQCSTRYYFNANNLCTQVSDTCKTYNGITGACTSCYQGYTINGTVCTVSQGNGNITDLNCKIFDTSNRCLECSYRYILRNNGVCFQVSDSCQTWNNSTGNCTSCYQGYQLSQGACVQGSGDTNCVKYDQNTKRCTQCSTRYYLNSNNICTQVTSQCQTWDNATGYCTSCYQGYNLTNGVCSASQQTVPEGCSSFNSQNNKCQSCQSNYCLDQNGICVSKPINCQTCEFTGGCAKCNNGYQLSNGQCVKNNNSRCQQYQGTKCILCQQNALLFDGACITYEQLRKILEAYWQNNSGNSGSTGSTANTTVPK